MDWTSELPAFVRDFLGRRREIPNLRKGLFLEMPDLFCFVRYKSVLLPYKPARRFRRDLPFTFVSGLLIDRDFWTDGAILVRYGGKKIKETEAFICADNASDLLATGRRVREAFLLFNSDLSNVPFVVMCGDEIWRAFLPVYIDYVSFKFKGILHDKSFYFSADGKGCVLTGPRRNMAYVSEYVFPELVKHQVDSLLRNYHEAKVLGDRSFFI
jgi:hypothetical protein